MDAVLQLKKRLGSEEKPEKGCIESRDEGDRLPRVIDSIFVSTVCSSHFSRTPKGRGQCGGHTGLEELPLISSFGSVETPTIATLYSQLK